MARRVLLDECTPKRLLSVLSVFEARTVQQMGWAGTINGRLLALATEQFDVFVTLDRQMLSQQNIDQLHIGVGLSERWADPGSVEGHSASC